MNRMTWIGIWMVSVIIAFIGTTNWGLVGVFGFNLVEFLIRWTWLQNTVYTLVAIAGVLTIIGAIMVLPKAMRR